MPDHFMLEVLKGAEELLVFFLSARNRAASDDLLSLRPTGYFLITVDMPSVRAEILLL